MREPATDSSEKPTCQHPEVGRTYIGAQYVGGGRYLFLWNCAVCHSTISGRRPMEDEMKRHRVEEGK